MERRSFFKRFFKNWSEGTNTHLAEDTPQYGGISMRNSLVNSEPFVGEIQMIGFNFAPQGWALCSGQLLPIRNYTTLFSILGTTYGGDGKNTFALPNLNGSFPMGRGQGTGLSQRTLGEKGGAETVELLPSNIPRFNTAVPKVTAFRTDGTQGIGLTPGRQLGSVVLNGNVPPPSPISNMPPYLAVNFIIAMDGIFPPRP
jgi:microcystin-dependent protein